MIAPPATDPATTPVASGLGGPARTVFFGSGPFAVPILEALLASPAVEVVGVVSVPDAPSHGPVDVVRRSRDLPVPLLQPRRLRDAETATAIGALRPALGVLADYGKLVPPTLLSLPAHGILNVHPSLLPRHRGASPIAAAIAAGDSESGVTIIAMDAGLDTGPIVAAEPFPLAGDETADALEATLARVAAGLMLRTVPGWLIGEIGARPQDATGATLTRPLRREDGRLDPTRPAIEIERQVRALRPWPGTFLETSGGRIIVLRAEPAPGLPGDRPGTLVRDDSGLALVTPDGRLRLLEVQPAGGRRMTGGELLRGRRALAGEAVKP